MIRSCTKFQIEEEDLICKASNRDPSQGELEEECKGLLVEVDFK